MGGSGYRGDWKWDGNAEWLDKMKLKVLDIYEWKLLSSAATDVELLVASKNEQHLNLGCNSDCQMYPSKVRIRIPTIFLQF